MRLADFDYELPQELIAQEPVEPRDAARLRAQPRGTGELADHHVSDLADLLRPGDLLVANRSRVLPARIHGTLRGGGHAELLLLKRRAPGRWQVLGRPARRLRPGDVVRVTDELLVTVHEAQPDGIREIEAHIAS